MNFGIKFTSHIDKQRSDKVMKALYKTIDYGAKKIKDEAQSKCAVKTGKTKRSIKIKSIKGGKSIGSDLESAIYLEFGTGYYTPFSMGPHKIYPIRAKFLHWIDEWGQDVFVKWTRGMMAQPFMRPALQVSRKPIANVLAKNIKKVLK